ncbi:MAG: hypothetical protein JXA66_05850 [Oligoflexia bacterium]|nr:hypothetical protein [Oligoflexia bacterium]
MDFPFSAGFKEQVKEFSLKYKCTDCIHFNEPETKCSFEYPINSHHYFYIMDFGHQYEPRFSFCKYFELN